MADAEQSDDNTVYVGSKPPMSYVFAVVTQFDDGHDRVHIKARGKAISTAVDVAEMVRNRFLEDVTVADVMIDTDTIQTEDQGEMKLSTIQINMDR